METFVLVAFLVFGGLVYGGLGWMLGEKIEAPSGKWIWGGVGLLVYLLFVVLTPAMNGNVRVHPLAGTIWAILWFSIPVAFSAFGYILGGRSAKPRAGRLIGGVLGTLIGMVFFLGLTFGMI